MSKRQRAASAVPSKAEAEERDRKRRAQVIVREREGEEEEEKEEKGEGSTPAPQAPRMSEAERASQIENLSLAGDLFAELYRKVIADMDVLAVDDMFHGAFGRARFGTAAGRDAVFHALVERDFRSPLTGKPYSFVTIYEYLFSHYEAIAASGLSIWPAQSVDYWARVYAACSQAMNGVDTSWFRLFEDDFVVVLASIPDPNNDGTFVEVEFDGRLAPTGFERVGGNRYAQPASVPQSPDDGDAVARRLRSHALAARWMINLHTARPGTDAAKFLESFRVYSTGLWLKDPVCLRAGTQPSGFVLNVVDMRPFGTVTASGIASPLDATPLFTRDEVQVALDWLATFLDRPYTRPPGTQDDTIADGGTQERWGAKAARIEKARHAYVAALRKLEERRSYDRVLRKFRYLAWRHVARYLAGGFDEWYMALRGVVLTRLPMVSADELERSEFWDDVHRAAATATDTEHTRIRKAIGVAIRVTYHLHGTSGVLDDADIPIRFGNGVEDEEEEEAWVATPAHHHFFRDIVDAILVVFEARYLDLFAAILPTDEHYGARCTVPATFSTHGVSKWKVYDGYFAMYTDYRVSTTGKIRLKMAVNTHVLHYDMDAVRALHDFRPRNLRETSHTFILANYLVSGYEPGGGYAAPRIESDLFLAPPPNAQYDLAPTVDDIASILDGTAFIRDDDSEAIATRKREAITHFQSRLRRWLVQIFDHDRGRHEPRRVFRSPVAVTANGPDA